MGCCNEPASTLPLGTLDPSQHVNFAKGMVLGVDDFTQEFAYLTGRDQWLARDAVGYGTVSGLRVFIESGAQGPQLHVTAGSALLPNGRLVCVPSDQCALLNSWLAKRDNAAIINRLLNPSSPPMPSSPPLSPPAATSGVVALYLTLCHAECTTRPVPIPGEPCRRDEELMAPSRIADDFRLGLREAAPVQTEEDSLRDFVRWLRDHVHIVDGGGSLPATWIDTLRGAAGAWLETSSPPATFASLGDYLFDLSPATIDIASDQVCDFLRVAFRFWVTELRPLWQAVRCQRSASRDQDCVLLARIDAEVEWIGGSPSGAWQVATGPDTVTIDETARPVLAHMRLLQEWLWCSGGGVVAPNVTSPPAPGPTPTPDSPPAPGPAPVSPPLSPAPDDADYIVASLNPALSNAQPLGALTTGLLLNTVAAGTGTLSTATAGTHYYAPGSTIPVADGGTGTTTAPANGQVLIGNGGTYVPANIAGVPNRITVTAGPGSVTVSTPQDIAPVSSPQFASLRTTAGRMVSAVASGNGNVALTPDHHVFVSTGIIPSTIRLPPAAPNAGRVYVIKNAKLRAIVVTLEAPPGNNIDGASTVRLNVRDAVTVVSTGTDTWHVIARA